MTARVLFAGLHLLDRQLLDRNGANAGNVDDLEITIDDETGTPYVTALLSGRGAWVRWFGFRRYADWLGSIHRDNDRSNRIPFALVTQINSGISLAAEHDELATYATEQWVCDHVISHIPGSRHAAE